MYCPSLGFFSFSVRWRKSEMAQQKFSSKLQSWLLGTGLVASTAPGSAHGASASTQSCAVPGAHSRTPWRSQPRWVRTLLPPDQTWGLSCRRWTRWSNLRYPCRFQWGFCFWIVAMQLVDFQQGVVVVPFLFALIERGALVDGCHRIVLVASCVLFSFCSALHVLCDTARLIHLNLSRSMRYCYNYSALPHGSG